MRIAKLAPHATTESLLQRMNTAGSPAAFKRWQAIYLTSIGLTAHEIATYIGTPTKTVEWWRDAYNHGESADSFIGPGRGGRRTAHMTLEEERDFLKRNESAASVGGVIIAGTIKSKWEAELKKSVSIDSVYDLLHRHNWRKVEPEHHHPKQDIHVQEDFKKNSPSSLLPH